MAGRSLDHRSILPFMQTALQLSTPPRRRVVNIGVCVSGGPDSMAMAHLLRQYTAQQDVGVYLTGFIVDHHARPESTDEAQQVQSHLRQIGIGSIVLDMQWAGGVKPLQLSDFESQARLKRYRLLSQAALDNDIQHLFLGHHQDDQIETIMMRLVRNRTLALSGLVGMASSALVPGCADMYGVHAEDRGLNVRAPASHSELSPNLMTSKHQHNAQQIMSPGGLWLHRPLLPFPKADLIATCQTNKVPYVVDPTNKDPTSCLRNAVRYLNRHFHLPAALGRTSILHLQQIAGDRLKQIKVAGDMILSQCQVRSLDIRSGMLTVYIPHQVRQTSMDNQACAYALAKLLEIVEPTSRADQSFKMPSHILSRLFDGPVTSHAGASPYAPSKAFSQGKVYIVPDTVQERTWTFSRQPMNKAEVMANTRCFSLDNAATTSLLQMQSYRSEFLLWDNRFWIRVSANRPNVLEQIVIRPLQPSDLSDIAQPFRSSETWKDFNYDGLISMLKKGAPGKMRFTVPVLTYRDKVIAFPTFKTRLDEVCHEFDLESLTWDVRYNAFSLLDTWTKP